MDDDGQIDDGHSDDTHSDEAADETKSSAVLIAVGVAIGLFVAFGIGPVLNAISGDDAEEAAPTPPPTVAVSTADDGAGEGDSGSDDADTNGDAVDLVVAYGSSRTANHALRGELLRPDRQPIRVRRAILDDRAIDETGPTAAVTEAGETRQCELIEGQWLCAPPLPAISAELDVQGFATLLLTEQPTYSVFAVSSEPPGPLRTVTALGSVTCWSMVSDGRVDRARFGAETTLCFHDEVGALVGRVTETSAGNDVFIATELTADVEIADVEPSR